MKKQFSFSSSRCKAVPIQDPIRNKNGKGKRKNTEKKDKIDEIYDQKQKMQDEESTRLAAIKMAIPNCSTDASADSSTKQDFKGISRKTLEKRYNMLYEQYEDIFYETKALESEKKNILLEIASIKKQEKRLLEMLNYLRSQGY